VIIAIASVKGGTGKTLVATSLALSLNDRDNVQLLDCDVEEPNDHIFLKPFFTHREMVTILVPKIDEEKCTYCGKCAEVCTHNAIAVMKEKAMQDLIKEFIAQKRFAIVDFVVPPEVTETTLKECKKLGLDRIWLQPGSESETAITYCHENNLKVVHDVCVMLS